MTATGRRSLREFWQPRFWPLWCVVGLLRALRVFPWDWQLAIGRGLGRTAGVLLCERRHVVRVNLALCFPALSPAERARLADAHFASLGMTLIEHGRAWWETDAGIARLVELRGLEHLQGALASGRGVVLLTGHFGAQEITGRALGAQVEAAAMYRPSKNPLLDELLRRVRGRSADLLIPKQDLRDLIRTLRRGIPVWFAPDQVTRSTLSALVPFCGEPAISNTALTTVARLGNAVVVPMLPARLEGARRYVLEILPPLADFPSNSVEADAARVNDILTAHIRKYPEQYWWVHRKFKGRPAPYPDPYARAP